MAEKDQETPAGTPERSKDAKVQGLGRAKQGHFLTPRDRLTLQRGPEYAQRTRREYRGERIARERRNQASAYARSRRKAMHQARGALQDLAFLADVMDPDWLYEVLMQTPTRKDSAEQRLGVLLGWSQSPLQRFLERSAEKVGLERLPEATANRNTVEWKRAGAFAVVEMLSSLERGLNAAEKGRQTHSVIHSISLPNRDAPGPSGGLANRRRPKL